MPTSASCPHRTLFPGDSTERHPAVAAALVEPWHTMLALAARDLTGVGGFEPPWWRELMMGARPEPREPEVFEPRTTRDGWQHEAASLRNLSEQRACSQGCATPEKPC